MSTNAQATIFDEYDDNPIVTIYKHWDGYPDGFGADLVSFANSKKIVNGIGGDWTGVSNGMGCFAAQLVASLKTQPGDVYLQAPTHDNGNQDYNYELHLKDDKVVVTCFDYQGNQVILSEYMKHVHDRP